MKEKMVVMQLLALVPAALVLSGCMTTTSQVTVSELDKSRTHSFSYFTDGKRNVLKGNLEIEGNEYPVHFYYDKEKSILVKMETKQCIVYNRPDRNLFGFIPPNALSNNSTDYNFTKVLDEGSEKKNAKVEYEISQSFPTEGKSTVLIENYDLAFNFEAEGDVFKIPEGVTCVEEDKVFAIG